MDVEILSGPPLNINRDLIKNPNSTFFAKISGHSLRDIGIFDNDILVIDKSLPWKNNALAVCVVDGGFTLKRILEAGGKTLLVPAAGSGKSIEAVEYGDDINREMTNVWGVVAYVVKRTY